MDRRDFCRTLLAGALAPALPALAQHEAWPTRPVRILAGGSGSVTDIRARWLAARLSPVVGQPVVVENKAGAGGILTMEAGARSAPDGHTLVIVHQGTVAVNPAIYPSLPYDPFRDFSPITRLGVGPLVLVVNPGLPAASLQELVALAKSRATPLTFATPGVGTPPHVAAELLKREAGIAATHVPYKTGGQAASDLIAGHVDFAIEGITVMRPHIEAGRVRALGTTGTQRVATLPAIPTLAQAGLPGYNFHGWVGIAAPAATPRPIIERAYAAIAQVMGTAEARDWFAQSGADPGAIPPAEFAEFMRAEHERLGKVLREAGVRAE
jgi:tripartite-type tricarboxylate transporter receptor subunit TctC